MIVETTVSLSRHERRVFETVSVSIGVGFPDFPYPKGDHREELIRALARLWRDGTRLDHAGLTRAIEALEVQVAQCAIEADLGHWKRVLLRPSPSRAGLLPSGGTALVADVDLMMEVLVESRSTQLREAQRALALARKALAQTSLPRDRKTDDYGDDDDYDG